MYNLPNNFATLSANTFKIGNFYVGFAKKQFKSFHNCSIIIIFAADYPKPHTDETQSAQDYRGDEGIDDNMRQYMKITAKESEYLAQIFVFCFFMITFAPIKVMSL